MTPFKVRFGFASAVVVDSEYPIHLDGLIAWAVSKEAEDNGSENPWADADDLSHILDREGEKDYVWKASRLLFTPASDRFFKNTLRKSDPDAVYNDWAGGEIDIPRMNESTFKINTNSGQMRGYQMLVASQWMEKAEAWGVGDIEVVQHYLSMIKFVGKLGRNGYGRVRSITVTESDPSESENWRIRVLPNGISGKLGVDYADVQQNVRAPYWDKTTRIPAREPIL